MVAPHSEQTSTCKRTSFQYKVESLDMCRMYRLKQRSLSSEHPTKGFRGNNTSDPRGCGGCVRGPSRHLRRFVWWLPIVSRQELVNVQVFNIKWYIQRKVTRTGPRYHKTAHGILTRTLHVRLHVFGVVICTFITYLHFRDKNSYLPPDYTIWRRTSACMGPLVQRGHMEPPPPSKLAELLED
jgi:hypothetical protein